MITTIRGAFAGVHWIILVVVAVVAVVGAGTALAVANGIGGQEGSTVLVHPPGTDWTLVASPQISRQQAMDEAVKTVPGATAVSAEIDSDRSTPVWEVELTTPDNIEYEVTIDANNGTVHATVNHD